ncbi:MAG TPA: sensor histidine kinase [Thermoleophilaceae bacterium]|nr:sensor histidine kinase [Thermoleophilaceae bacterium]
MSPHYPQSEFRHAAVFYDGDASYVDRLVPFIRGGLEVGEPVLVMVPGPKLDLLRDALGDQATEVRFADMLEVGSNPARIIPAWGDFAAAHAGSGRRTRGVGEPIWSGRTAAELVECQRHEALINVAFEGAAAMDLVCPYDENALEPEVLEEARRSHPVTLDACGTFHDCSTYVGTRTIAKPFARPLPDVPPGAARLEFDPSGLPAVRVFVAAHAAAAGLSAERCEDLALALNELATNSIRHGGGSGSLSIWTDHEAVVAEVRDRGQIDRPLAGREQPAPGQVGGHGLWLVNQLCDLMQMRTFSTGSVVRVHMRRA